MDSSAAEIDMIQLLTAHSPETLTKLAEMIRLFQDTGKAVVLPKGIKKTKKRNKIKDHNRTLGAKRPLNSFMAFRAYYSPLFASQQQKNISGFINNLWIADPFKSKWTILAAAYSIIRDQNGKANAPLATFLALVCPKIHIIAPSTYLQQMGWIYSATKRELHRQYVPNQANFQLTTNQSVKDIVAYADEQGYGAGATSSTDVAPSHDVIMAVNPSNLKQVGSDTVFAAISSSLNDHNCDSSPDDRKQGAGDPEHYQRFEEAEPVSDIAMHMHANNALLSASEDCFPFPAQFISDHTGAETGLYMDMSYHINDQDAPVFFDDFIQF